MDFTFDRIKTIVGELNKHIVVQETLLDNISYVPCGYKQGNVPPKDGWMPFKNGDFVTGKDAHFWFRFSCRTPKVAQHRQIQFYMSNGLAGTWDATNPQGLVYINGKITQGLDVNHNEVLLEPDTDYDFYLYFYTGMHEQQVHVFLSLQEIDRRVEGLYYDMSVPLDTASIYNPDDKEYIEIMSALLEAERLLDLRSFETDAFYASVDKARDYLKNTLYAEEREGGPLVTCIGHTHIDVAWQWTLAQTREKVQRTFSTVLQLMKQYPEYTFMSSQPQLYKYLKQEAPDLYKEVQQMVKEGRWEAEGAMWLEADCNLSSGESLVRQILHGKQFMQDELGVDNKILWLPDVFGYSAALPQILKKSGVDKFVTSKISWNETNKMPYDTFMWKGLDGTEIFTYFLTAQDLYKKDQAPERYTTYVGYSRPTQVYGTWKRYQQKEYNDETILTYGYGDGGGGPTKDMIEQQRRMQYGLPGLPKTVQDTATNMLSRAEEKFLKNCKRLGITPKWSGELYLEYHRGTYTTQAKNKKNNRQSELSYQAAEGAAYAAYALLNKEYPKQALHDGWEIILLNQFHDIIPGSSIREVYEDSTKQYEEVLATSKAVFDGSLQAIAKEVKTEGGLLVYNPNSYPYTGVVATKDGAEFVENIPALGWKVVQPKAVQNTVKVEKNSLENEYLAIRFDETGRIVSLFDKEANREVAEPGEALNKLHIYEDYPRVYDAWEICNYYKDKKWDVTASCMEIVNDGARKGMKITYKYRDSEIVQTVYLAEGSRRVDFETEVEWHEVHSLLRAEFPFDVHATEATYEIQFGQAKRSNHKNTSWDAAKFEVCAHKWADLSESGYGVSLLNDCKYGHSAEDNVLGISLLRAPTYPDETADQGHHSFTYSLYPHNGGLGTDTVQNAMELNRPAVAIPVAKQEGKLPDCWSLVQADSKNVVIDTVKMAEKGDALIVRLYECQNSRVNTKLTFGLPVKHAEICDMMEQNGTALDVADNTIALTVKPFEIVTLKIEF